MNKVTETLFALVVLIVMANACKPRIIVSGLNNPTTPQGGVVTPISEAKLFPGYFLNTGATPVSVTSADLDGDGDLDLITADSSSNQLSVFFNNGSGVFGAAISYATGSQPYSVTSADLDSDGDIDLISADTSSDELSVLMNARIP
jgi:hypothetical protein